LPSSGTVTGTYQWHAVYSGDSNNNSANDQGGSSEQATVLPAHPSILTTPSVTSVTLGTTSPAPLKDTAVLSGGYFPTGTITFTLLFNGSTVDTETVNVSGNGSYTTPTGYTLPTTGTVTGTYQWNATYSGDGNNHTASETGSADEQVTVNPASPTITTSANPTSATVGTLLKDTATLSGGYFPTGTITFRLTAPDGTTVVDTETVTVSGNGTYSTPAGFNATTAGTYQWSATYNGDGNNKTVTSAAGSEPVVITNPQVSQITPTQTTCSQFSSGTSPTEYEVEYGKKGTTISQVNPGVFFYWVGVSVPSSGSKTFTITQSRNSTNSLFAVASGSSAFTPSCGTLSTNIQQSGGTITVTFTAPTTASYPAKFFIGIKFSTSAVVGNTRPTTGCTETDPADPGPVSNCAAYTFQSFVGTGTSTPVAGSTSGIILEPKDTN
jgi:hypothetical protein